MLFWVYLILGIVKNMDMDKIIKFRSLWVMFMCNGFWLNLKISGVKCIESVSFVRFNINKL